MMYFYKYSKLWRTTCTLQNCFDLSEWRPGGFLVKLSVFQNYLLVVINSKNGVTLICINLYEWIMNELFSQVLHILTGTAYPYGYWGYDWGHCISSRVQRIRLTTTNKMAHWYWRYVIDKLRVPGIMKNKLRAQRGVYFCITQVIRSLSSLSYCSFVSHKDPPSLVTFKDGKVWLLG